MRYAHGKSGMTHMLLFLYCGLYKCGNKLHTHEEKTKLNIFISKKIKKLG